MTTSVLSFAAARYQRMVDTYANALQSGDHAAVQLELGIGQVAALEEAAKNLGLNLAAVNPNDHSREDVWAKAKDADVILLDGVLNNELLPGETLAKNLMDGHFFGQPLEHRPTVIVRTTRPELFPEVSLLD